MRSNPRVGNRVLLVCLQNLLVGTWMLCGNGYGLIWTLMDVVMVGTRLLCGNGYGLIWTLSWLAHGCSAGMDMV